MKAIAPGKLILSGEHAVVYGKPAIAMAIDRSAVFEMSPQANGQFSFDLAENNESESITLLALNDLKKRVLRNYRQFLAGEIGICDVLTKPADLFKFAFINTLDGVHRHLDAGLCFTLRSSIPIGCGMGSSAATVLSELRALGHYLRVDFKPEWYYRYSMEAESLQHGRPSGVDSYISLHGGCAIFQNGEASSLCLPRMKLFMVHTGVPESSTGECIMNVEKGFKNSLLWNDFEGVTQAMESAIQHNDVVRFRWLVRENNRLLVEIGVVPQKVRTFIDEIEKWGGAAKICGAGAIKGNNAGIVLISADEAPHLICEKYGYTVSPVRGDPLGTRMV